ncbi:hypothetical protein [Bradyrhizobium septentrionale]|uniref:Band 7 domain-containing protein n=1 Tax=Bradyrhizobium septentrionale TaxID=1404411 RepID=A0ABZ2P7B9_9BRAD
MSGYDIFAWIVLLILVASAIGVFCIAGWLPGHIAKAIEAVPFVVRVKLDDAAFANRLPAGSAGTAAIYTDHLKPTHVVRRVILRQVAIVNYVNPF